MILNRRSLLTLTSSFAALAATGAYRAAFAYTATAPAATDAAAKIDPATIQDFGIGDVNAKVKIDEYLSFTCPHCEHFHSTIYPQLKADYIDTGKVRLVYHEVYFDQLGLLGALLARCGGEMRYMGIVDMLYNKQRDWAAASDMTAAVGQLTTFGRAAGMADADIDKCLHDQAMAEALVAHYQASIAQDYPNDSFEGTPSFRINGVAAKEMNANMAYDDLKKLLDAELAK